MQDDGFTARFLAGTLATWRLAHLVAAEDGPADAIVRLRAQAGHGPLGGLMDCFYCLSMWTAAPVAVAVSRRRREVPLTWLALSGAACVLERVFFEEKGEPDVLWEEAQAGAEERGEADAREPGRDDRRLQAATPR